MSDLLVIGGGVVGLSIAYEAAGRGRSVRLIDSQQPGREASWAGAGILPPAGEQATDSLGQLTALSNRIHRYWADSLRQATSIDNGLRDSGAIYVARDDQAREELGQLHAWATAEQIAIESLTPAELDELEPAIRPRGDEVLAARLPGECQIRNPRHLKALIAGCAQRGVEIIAGAAAEDFDVRGGTIQGVRTARGKFAAQQYCLSTGSWSAALARRLRLKLAIKPIRGQIALLCTPRPLFSHIVNEGKRYLVPRPDGRVIVGSTEEDAGFDRSTTAGAIAELIGFATSLVPELAAARLERSWAGLRPATRDGLPYIGRVPELDNAWVAAGHFRSGLQLSAGTAIVINQLLAGEPTSLDLAPFRVDRHTTTEATSLS